MHSSMMLQGSRRMATPSAIRSTPITWRPLPRLTLSRPTSRPTPLAAAAAAPVAAPISTPASTSPWPTSAETARTIMSLTCEGTLSTISEDGTPLGTPVSYTLHPDGTPMLRLDALQLSHLKRSPRCSIMIQPIAFPARGVASVALVGQLRAPGADAAPAEAGAPQLYPLVVEHCLYFGGLDQRMEDVSQAELASAVPDVLRQCASTLVLAWNSDRAEDMYRVVSDFLEVQITEMAFAELLWVDRLGMYVRCEVIGRAPTVVRVPFYRAATDERDARSIITMAAQLAWERERNYTPPSLAALDA